MNEIITNEQFKTAVELNQKIIITAQAAQQNLFDMCVMLKQMRDDKLYKELGYPNFEEYCENEIGITRRQGLKYSKIGDMYSVKNGKSTSHFANIGTEKLYLLASLSESQQEEIQQTVNIEDTSVRELKAEIAKLKADKADTEKALAAQREETEAVSSQARTERQRAEQAEDDLQDAKRKIKELERRPIDVPAESPDTELLRSQLAEAEQKIKDMENGSRELRDANLLIKQLDRQLSEETQDHANSLERQRKQYQSEINRLNALIEEQKTAVKTVEKTVEVPDMKEVFKAYYKNAIGAFNAMLTFVESLDGDRRFYIKKAGQLVSTLYDSLEKMEEES